jgi:hypothetical protein
LGSTYIIKTRRLAKRRSQLISSYVKLQFNSRLFLGGSDYNKLPLQLFSCQNAEGRHQVLNSNFLSSSSKINVYTCDHPDVELRSEIRISRNSSEK